MRPPHEASLAKPDTVVTRISRLVQNRQGGAWLALLFATAVGLVTRIALLIKAVGEVSWNLSLLASFCWGLVFDIAAALWWVAPLALVLTFIPARAFRWRLGRIAAHAALYVVLYALLFGVVAEWFFWDEFGARFNFIAVDYLVYTTEVIGNIRESYPMPAIYGGLFAATAIIYLAVARAGLLTRWLDTSANASDRGWARAGTWVAAMLVIGLGLRQNFIPNYANNYNRELAKSGLWSLFAEFWNNQLDYDRFYPVMPSEAAFKRVHQLLAKDGSRRLATDPHDLLRMVEHEGPEQRLNVIQITVESLSADFLSHFNRVSKLMPNMEQIAAKSLVFEQFYATGTRTDRGMEALTLSVPPTPGRSLVKRPNNERLFTLGSVFRSKGYETAFIYGGFGYFDNMNYFFGENGYRVVDRTMVEKKDITFSNVWGACDEDLFRWTLRECDRDYAAGKPFFHFVMTTSNHRPFTYPDGKIDLPSKVSGRSGGVKYTDYAIGELMRQAARKPWFKDTIFVFVGDHCASSAGKTELPVENYHIPLVIYAPGGQVKPGIVHAVTSQVDYAPTLLGLLRWSYPSRFYGRDVLAMAAGESGRALIGNYQKLGLFQGNKLAVLKPVRQSVTASYNPASHALQFQAPDAELVDDAIAYYQTASWLFSHQKQAELTPAEALRFTFPPNHVAASRE